VHELSQVFQQPAAYHGKIFCGTAYNDFQSGMYSFYPARLESADDAYGYALLLIGLSQRQEQQLKALPRGSALRIIGTLDTSRSCTNPPRADLVEECAPISHPIYIEKARFSRE